MAKTNKIIWRKDCLRQIKEIRKYIAFGSPIAAKKVVQGIRERIIILEKEPFAGPIEETFIQFGLEYRYLVQGNYKILYTHFNDVVYISSVFDTRRNPDMMGQSISDTE